MRVDPYHHDEQVTVYHGDCLNILTTVPDNSIDAIVTDPPYNLGFMGKQWDQFKQAPRQIQGTGGTEAPFAHHSVPVTKDDGHGFQQWCQEWATECLRILKPGGHIAAFGGTRTWHRLAVAVEDAGFEIRDNLAWLYGSGFPKSLDVSKAIDKAAGAEREVIGRKLNPDGTERRRPKVDARGNEWARPWESDEEAIAAKTLQTAPATDLAKQWQGWGTALKPSFEPIILARKPIRGTVAANVVEHGTGALNIDACRVAAVAGDDHQRQRLVGRNAREGWGLHGAENYQAEPAAGRWPANVLLDPDTAAELDKQSGNVGAAAPVRGTEPSEAVTAASGITGQRKRVAGAFHADQGGASRFFPVFRYTPKAPGTERPTADGVSHPTVKPLELMRWLVKLITPPNGVVLDPFAGTGTTAEAAIHEHKRAIVIEREPTYLPLIVARLNKPMQVGFDFNGDNACER